MLKYHILVSRSSASTNNFRISLDIHWYRRFSQASATHFRQVLKHTIPPSVLKTPYTNVKFPPAPF